MKLPPELQIRPEEWEKAPASVQVVVILHWQENQKLKEQVAKLHNQVEKMQAELDTLRERVNKNSQNSSKPPSSDGPEVPNKPKGEASGRTIGGQPGHVGHGRQLRRPEQVHKFKMCKPDTCEQCGALLLGEDPHPERHQVSELPKPEALITEYQLHTLTCMVCGAKTCGE